MDVSIIIVNYNSTALTEACLHSVFRHTQGLEFEVLLIDNASPEQDLPALETRFPQVRFIYNEQNGGFSKANNQGMRESRGKYLFLLNPDTLLTSNAIQSFFDFMEQADENTACCGGALFDEEGNAQVSYGNFPSIAETLALLGPLLFYKRYYEQKLSAGVKVYQKEPQEVDYISGAALFIRKSVMKEAGGLDEDFFMYFEETRLAFVLKERGYRSILLPQVKIVHLEGGSQSAAKKKEKQERFASSRRQFMEKSYGSTYAKIAHLLYQIQQRLYHAFNKGNTR